MADAYEAMTSDRAYRRSIGHAAARAELKRCAGSQFDRRVVKAFITIIDRESRRAETMLAHEPNEPPPPQSSAQKFAKVSPTTNDALPGDNRSRD